MFRRSWVFMFITLCLLAAVPLLAVAQQPTALMMAEDSEKLVDEAWQKYQEYLQAIKQGSWEKLKLFLPEEYARKMEQESDISKTMQALQDLSANHVRILEGWIDQGKAHLVVEGEVWGGVSKGIIVLAKEKGRWKIREEAWKAKKDADDMARDIPGLTIQGSATVSGVVVLPEVEETGNLYVSFVPEGQSSSEAKLYQVIPAEEITSREVPFKIADVPEGTYRGFATWDIAAFYWEPSWGEGNCPGYAGDYTGGTRTPVTVTSGQPTENVRIECLNFLEPIVAENYGKEYELKDLHYERDVRDNAPRILVTIENTGDKPVQEINLQIVMNGFTFPYFVSGMGGLIDPGEEQEFDLVEAYKMYLRDEPENTTRKIYDLDMTVTSRDNGSSLRKKVLITGVTATVSPKTFKVEFN